MKPLVSKTLIASLLLLFLSGCSGGKQKSARPQTGDQLTGTIQLSGAFALYPMVVRWAEEFRALHPNVKIDISGGGAGKGMTDALAGVVDIGMVSRDIYPEELKKGAYPIAVVEDAVVLTVNAGNPELASIRKVGITKEKAARLWNEEVSTWGQLLGTPSTLPVHVLTRSDACGAAETFAAWLGRKQENLKATAVFGDPGVSAAVQKDRVGVGYNNISYAYDQRTGKPYEGLAILPMDVDGNGRITADEDFYGTLPELIKAIKERRYPSPPARDLYLVTKGKPKGEAVVEFLEYVLTEGQKHAAETGYIGLAPEKLQVQLTQLRQK